MSTVVYDSILGKLREAEIGGGTGGGGADYFAGTGIGIAGNTIYANDIPLSAIPALSGRSIFSKSAATLAANTNLVAVYDCDNMKSDYITFFCNFSDSFGTLAIKHVSSGQSCSYLKITDTNVEVYDQDNTLIESYEHGLTLSTFVYVVLYKQNNEKRLSNLWLSSDGGSYTVKDIHCYGNFGAVQAVASFACTNAEIKYIVDDADKDVWVFGDSYIVFEALGQSWAYDFVANGHNQVAFIGRGGSKAGNAKLSFDSLITKTRPRYIVWAMGQNDPDSGEINGPWKTATDAVMASCAQLGITMILCTIPCVPQRDHTYKNAYIKSLNLRYIDFAKAVNAESAGATWYTGMLSADSLHPSALGANTLLNQFILDMPESVCLDNSSDLGLTEGFRVDINGETIGVARYIPVETITGSTATVLAGHAYKINATSGAFTIDSEVVQANEYGLDGHIEIFVGNTGFVQTTNRVVLANALEPDAVNNCTVRFHDGFAIISVEDHVAGYIVTVNAASGAGSLNYGLATASNEYISVDASLNGQTFDLAGVTTYAGEKHVVGNGYTETIISGGINCTSKTTLSNLAADGVIVSSGTLTLGDVFIPSGSTVAVSGGGLAIENVTGDGGTINLGGKNVTVMSGNSMFASGCTFSGGSATHGGCIITGGYIELEGCNVTNCSATNLGGALTAGSLGAKIVLKSTTVSGCYTPQRGGGILAQNGGYVVLSHAKVVNNSATYGNDICLGGSNTYLEIDNSSAGIVHSLDGGGHRYVIRGNCSIAQIRAVSGAGGSCTIESGTSIALTYYMTPGGTITVQTGGCTVNGASISGGTYTSIVSSGGSAVAS